MGKEVMQFGLNEVQKETVENNSEGVGWGSAQKGPGVAHYVMDRGVSLGLLMSRVTVLGQWLRAQADQTDLCSRSGSPARWHCDLLELLNLSEP